MTRNMLQTMMKILKSFRKNNPQSRSSSQTSSKIDTKPILMILMMGDREQDLKAKEAKGDKLTDQTIKKCQAITSSMGITQISSLIPSPLNKSKSSTGRKKILMENAKNHQSYRSFKMMRASSGRSIMKIHKH